jgi:hypothetical protein
MTRWELPKVPKTAGEDAANQLLLLLLQGHCHLR